jgi:hypothetical protein
MKDHPHLVASSGADEVMERGRKDGLSACSTVSLWTTDARTPRDVHDLDRSKVVPAASGGARKQVSCRATPSLSCRNELGRIVRDHVGNSEINSANAKRHFVWVLSRRAPIRRPPLRRVTVAGDEVVFTISSVSERPPSRSALQFSPNRRTNHVFMRWVRTA